MEIHKPKAAHTMGEFAREMAAVVLGILIALALEQAVEAAHWKHAVDEGEASLKAEVADQADFYALRIAVNGCQQQRIALLQGIAEHERAGLREAPVGPIPFPTGALIRRDGWAALSSGAVLAHLRPERLQTYSAIYSQAIDIRMWETDEETAWDSIRLLEGDPNKLSPADLTQIRTALSAARRMNYLIVLNGKLQLERIESLGVPAPKAIDPSRERDCQPIARS